MATSLTLSFKGKERVLVFPEICHGCGACRYLCAERVIFEEGREIGHLDGVEFVHGGLSIGEGIPTMLAIPLI